MCAVDYGKERTPATVCGWEGGQIVSSITLIKKPGGRLRKGRKAHKKYVCPELTARLVLSHRATRFLNRFTKLQDHIEKYYESGLVSFIDQLFAGMTHKQRRAFLKNAKGIDSKSLRYADRRIRGAINFMS